MLLGGDGSGVGGAEVSIDGCRFLLAGGGLRGFLDLVRNQGGHMLEEGSLKVGLIYYQLLGPDAGTFIYLSLTLESIDE